MAVLIEICDEQAAVPCVRLDPLPLRQTVTVQTVVEDGLGGDTLRRQDEVQIAIIVQIKHG